MSDRKLIKDQILKTLTLLKIKAGDGEPIINEYIVMYEKAYNTMAESDLKALLTHSRGYLETSSDWGQPFLQEMSNTEKLIKAYV